MKLTDSEFQDFWLMFTTLMHAFPNEDGHSDAYRQHVFYAWMCLPEEDRDVFISILVIEKKGRMDFPDFRTEVRVKQLFLDMVTLYDKENPSSVAMEPWKTLMHDMAVSVPGTAKYTKRIVAVGELQCEADEILNWLGR